MNSNRIIMVKPLLLLFLLLSSLNVKAVLKIEITQGVEGAIPIAIEDFSAPAEEKPAVNIAKIIRNNLLRSGLFSPYDEKKMAALSLPKDELHFAQWKAEGMDYLVIGKVIAEGPGSYTVNFQLFDVLKASQLIGYRFAVDVEQMRAIAHKISDLVYEKITGIKGAFSTRIAYVSAVDGKKGKKHYYLKIADSDGYNAKVILSSRQPIMSPNWSADGKYICYVSFEKRRSTVYLQEIKTGERKKIVSMDGINGAPALSPDGKQIAVTLSYQGNAEIYIIDLATGKRKRFTHNSGIDTEAAWMPDGSAIVFTSDRSGSPQIYRKSIKGGRAKRLTYEGRYNSNAAVSADGKSIAMVQGDEGRFRIALMDLASHNMRLISDGMLDESPSFAPNDSMILYASEKNFKGVFGAVSFDGRMKQVFSLSEGSIREPVWSPF